VQYRRLGKTGWNVSTISLGCWGIGGQWGPVAEDEAIRVMHEAIELGVNLFDTADAYGPMTSENLVGRALQGRRDKVYVATKVGNFGRRQGSPFAYDIPEHIYQCCDASLHRMQTDHIDLYQCHIGDLVDPSVFLEAFERLVEQGKVRAYGVSTNSLAVAQAFNRDGKCSAIQLNFSIVNPGAAADLLPWCAANDVGTLIRGPIAQGVLAGKFTAETRFDDSVRKGWNEGPAREQFLKRLAIVDRIEFLERPGRTMAQSALQWVLTNSAVTCAIPGAKSVEQIRANAGAADGTLSQAELDRVATATAV
jgi:aryl-alcohol dehydrogenase-like predicted oxidoreductase